MNRFQILCTNGCGKEPEWFKITANIINLSIWIIPLIIVIYAFYKLVDDKNKNKKKANKEFIKRIILAVAVLLIISLIQLIFLINFTKGYDEVANCWCK